MVEEKELDKVHKAPVDEKKLEKNVKKVLNKIKQEEKKVSVNRLIFSLALSFIVFSLIAGGFLYYIHNSDNDLIERGMILGMCYFPAGISCQDSMVLDEGIALKLMNGFPHKAYIKSIYAGDCYAYPNITLNNIETQWFNLTGCNLTRVFNKEIILVYINPESGLDHTINGKIQTTLSSDESSKFIERINYEYNFIINWFRNQFRKIDSL